jgi:hypothetical protein
MESVAIWINARIVIVIEMHALLVKHLFINQLLVNVVRSQIVRLVVILMFALNVKLGIL